MRRRARDPRPLLLYGPPLLDIGAFDVRTVAAVTMVQVFVSAIAGMLAHHRHGAVNGRLAGVGGVSMSRRLSGLP